MVKYVDAKIYANFKHLYISLHNHKFSKIRSYWIFVLLDIVDLIEEEEKNVFLKPAFEDFMLLEHEEETDMIILDKLYELFLTFYRLPEEKKVIVEKKPPKTRSSKKKKTIMKEPVKKIPTSIFTNSKDFFKRVKGLNKWRVEKKLIETLYNIVEESEIMDIFDDFSSVMLSSMEKGCIQIRKAASVHLVRGIVLLPSFEKRKMIMKDVFDNFYVKSNFQKKETFLYFAESCINNFSRAALRYFILNQTLALCDSPIMSVMISVLRLFPKIYLLLQGGEDDKIFAKMNEVKKKWSKTENKRLRNELRNVNSAIQIGMRSKKRQMITKAKYEKNKKLEEELLLYKSEENSLKEMYIQDEKAAQGLKNKLKGFDLKKNTYTAKFSKVIGIDRFPTSFKKYGYKNVKKMKSYNLDDKNGVTNSTSKRKRKNSGKKKKR